MSKEPRRGWGARLARGTLAAGAVGIALTAVGCGIAWYEYDQWVIRNPGPEFNPEHIRSIISEESPVYYRDGTTRIGVFFEDEHRQYVPFAELPPAYVMAIVAAEDGHFWSHAGVDARHVARAMFQNLTSGGVVAGGSTLTQQTAKNLFYRPDRSLKSKGTELLNALRLEAHYDKSQILTFYANQFHVVGNGRGFGIAARYFFDASPADLQRDLVKCAFLAGLVKGPAQYDPFVGDEAHRQRAAARAKDRTRYVLRRMVDEPEENLAGPLPIAGDAGSEAAYRDRLARVREVKSEAARLLEHDFELPFKKGTFRYESSAVLDEVARRLREPPFRDVLEKAGIADPSTAGLVVVTTLDAEIERESEYSLWHHLTDIGTQLEGRRVSDFIRADGEGPLFEPDRQLHRHEFRLAVVKSVEGKKGAKHLALDLGGQRCVADRAALVRVAGDIEKGKKKDRTAKVGGAAVDAVAEQFPAGSVVLASIRDLPSVAKDGKPVGSAVCDLELRPELQGAVVVLEGGHIRAMVGGNDNRNFNRATALRQFGSTWKPIVYHSALQLGWRPTDLLDNRRNPFTFSTTVYWPSPDHAPAPAVSLSWAGVNSENLASIWLLYHLTDRLDATAVAELAQRFGLARGEAESPEQYRTRMQRAGILPVAGRIDEALFLQARNEVASRLGSEGRLEEEMELRSMLHGANLPESVDGADRVAALSRSWQRMSSRGDDCRRAYERLAAALDGGTVPAVPELRIRRDGQRVEVYCAATELPEGAVVADGSSLAGVVTADAEESKPGFFQRLLGSEPEPAARLAPPGDLRVGGVTLATLDAVRQGIERRQSLNAVDEEFDPYAPEVLYQLQDFRVLLAMKYVAAVAREYGVRTGINEVMSMPLGASEITLEEAAATYAGLVSGQSWQFPGLVWGDGSLMSQAVDSPADPALLIAEIRDVDGRQLYLAKPRPQRVASPEVSGMTADILRNVVLHGTGRRAAAAVLEQGVAVPVGGKTGTTNDFKNVAFVGYAPSWDGDAYSVDKGHTVAVYVGYDDNRPMTSGAIRLAGASGALPAWIGVVQGMQASGALGHPPGPPPVEGGWPLREPSLSRVAVDPKTGVVTEEGVTLEDTDAEDGAPVGPATVLTRPGDAVFEPIEQIHAHPVRTAPSTTSAPTDVGEGSLWGSTP
jgi:penicillin-binding protein 1A